MFEQTLCGQSGQLLHKLSTKEILIATLIIFDLRLAHNFMSLIVIFAVRCNNKPCLMTLGLIGGHTVPRPTDGHELASSSLTESWGDVRLVLAADSAGRWVVRRDDTEDTACLLESLPHLHLVGQTQTASDCSALMNHKYTISNSEQVNH